MKIQVDISPLDLKQLIAKYVFDMTGQTVTVGQIKLIVTHQTPASVEAVEGEVSVMVAIYT